MEAQGNIQYLYMSVVICNKKVNKLILRLQKFSADILYMHVKFSNGKALEY
jgi:hypothetical protein